MKTKESSLSKKLDELKNSGNPQYSLAKSNKLMKTYNNFNVFNNVLDEYGVKPRDVLANQYRENIENEIGTSEEDCALDDAECLKFIKRHRHLYYHDDDIGVNQPISMAYVNEIIKCIEEHFKLHY